MDGTSLKSGLNGKTDEMEFPEIILSATTSEENPEDTTSSVISKFSVIKDHWKLIWSTTTNDIELYNLEDDPKELTDCKSVHQEKVNELKKILDDEYIKIDDLESEEDRKIMKKKLKDLGYI
jgi:hypothetical protein